MSLAAKLRHELAATIGSPAWRAALETVPREVFLGQAVYRYEPERGWVPVRRSDEIGEGEKIMEIGAGYSTALMCCRLGDDAVTSVEFDPVIAARAKAAIAEAGYMPMLVQGDGLLGYEADAPYDRLIATCAVRTIPRAWVRQVRQGGTITAPMLGWTGGVAFARLHVTDVDDTETGSHADVRPAFDGGWVVHQDGPIRIWDAIEKAIAMWQEAGSPHQSGFGLTVTRESQRVWLGEPDGPRWELP
jgi:protein-L-isoaspartate O-methyltransferase